MHVLVACTSIGGRGGRCMGRGVCSFLRGHALQVNLNDLALEDAEVSLGPDVSFVRATGTNDADRGVVDGELLVLLERLSQRMQAMLNELLQCA